MVHQFSMSHFACGTAINSFWNRYPIPKSNIYMRKKIPIAFPKSIMQFLKKKKYYMQKLSYDSFTSQLLCFIPWNIFAIWSHHFIYVHNKSPFFLHNFSGNFSGSKITYSPFVFWCYELIFGIFPQCVF